MEPQEPLAPWIEVKSDTQFRIDPKKLLDFFSKLATALTRKDAGKGIEAFTVLAEMVKGAPKPEEVAGILLKISMTNALYRILDKNEATLKSFFALGRKEFVLEQKEAIRSHSLFLNADFYRDVYRSEFVRDVSAFFERWLAFLGVPEDQRKRLAATLPNEFLIALTEEWRRKPEFYAKMQADDKNPFVQAAEREYLWAKYRQTLIDAFNTEPMFEETFGLAAVYVGLRAYHTAKDKERGEVKRVVNLEQKIDEWLSVGSKTDTLRVISGGPGSGKSSFGKMLAAKLAQQGRYVLFIPLQHLENSMVVSAMGTYLTASGWFKHNPLDGSNADTPLLLICDGLDELAQEGKASEEMAGQFIANLKQFLETRNMGKLHVQAMVSGREPVIQTHAFKLDVQDTVLHLLPYKLLYHDLFANHGLTKYDDPTKMLKADQRDTWWKRYAFAKGRPETTMPEVLKREELEDITREPLLNYLVALSYERSKQPDAPRKLDFSTETNRNRIYADLLFSVYERPWGNKRNPQAKGISEHQFYTLLEEIALVTWRGGGRTATLQSLQEHCGAQNANILKIFEQGSEEKGVHRLITAFYFRQGQREANQEKTFEFTHKSFGEYLTARRLVRELAEIHDQRRDNKSNSRKGWTMQQALTAWAQLTGNTPIDWDLLPFLRDEIALLPADPLVDGISTAKRERHAERPKPVELLQTLCELAGDVIANEMPMQEVKPILATFGEMNRQARNAELALLAAINACALTKEDGIHMVVIPWSEQNEDERWKNSARAFEWFNRLRGQEIGYRAFFSSLLAGLDLTGMDLNGSDLRGADLRGVNFFGADLYDANLDEANVCGALCLEYADNLDFAKDFDRAKILEQHQPLLEQWKQNQRERATIFDDPFLIEENDEADNERNE